MNDTKNRHQTQLSCCDVQLVMVLYRLNITPRLCTGTKFRGTMLQNHMHGVGHGHGSLISCVVAGGLNLDLIKSRHNLNIKFNTNSRRYGPSQLGLSYHACCRAATQSTPQAGTVL